MQLHGRYGSQKCLLPPWETIARIGGGGQKFLLERGEKPVKRAGGDVEMGGGGLPHFLLL